MIRYVIHYTKRKKVLYLTNARLHKQYIRKFLDSERSNSISAKGSQTQSVILFLKYCYFANNYFVGSQLINNFALFFFLEPNKTRAIII